MFMLSLSSVKIIANNNGQSLLGLLALQGLFGLSPVSDICCFSIYVYRAASGFEHVFQTV
jgi:hypothetical protein